MGLVGVTLPRAGQADALQMSRDPRSEVPAGCAGGNTRWRTAAPHPNLCGMSTTPPTDEFLLGSANTELASNRTALALERTRMSAERTLMAGLRTALALIGFGFTIVKFFREVGKQLAIEATMQTPARNFGISLVLLGIGLLVASLYAHWQSFGELRQRRDELHGKGLLRRGARNRTSPTAVVAVLLLLAALLVLLGIIARSGPFD